MSDADVGPQREYDHVGAFGAALEALEAHLTARVAGVGCEGLTRPERVCLRAGRLDYQLLQNGHMGLTTSERQEASLYQARAALRAVGADCAAAFVRRMDLVLRRADNVRRGDEAADARWDRWEDRRIAALLERYYASAGDVLGLVLLYARDAADRDPAAFPAPPDVLAGA